MRKGREKTVLGGEKGREKTAKSREKIISLLSDDGSLSAVGMAGKIGISAKAVEKHLARLKVEGIIERVGPAKGGRWIVKNEKLNCEVQKTIFYDCYRLFD